LSNLRIYSTQTSEGMNAVLMKTPYHRITLLEACLQTLGKGGWAKGYHEVAIDSQEHYEGRYRNRGKDIVIESVHNLLDQLSQLLPELSEKLMKQIVAINNEILAEVRALQAKDQQVPPDWPLTFFLT
jgi:hypothetical protein